METQDDRSGNNCNIFYISSLLNNYPVYRSGHTHQIYSKEGLTFVHKSV